MPPKKATGTIKRAKKEPIPEYRFKIDAFTPATMPMARLAEYMQQLALILGETSAVHFSKLETGSTVVVSRVEREALPKVRERALGVHRGDAPQEAQFAFRKINKLLREDNAVGTLTEKGRRAKILAFPGRDEVAESFASVSESGSIDGIVVRVGGTDRTIPILLESEGQQIANCFTTREIAKKLAQVLFEPVRLHGTGSWLRNADGQWSLKQFRVLSFEPLGKESLQEVLENLRAIPVDWDADAYVELETVRQGRRRNGSN